MKELKRNSIFVENILTMLWINLIFVKHLINARGAFVVPGAVVWNPSIKVLNQIHNSQETTIVEGYTLLPVRSYNRLKAVYPT